MPVLTLQPSKFYRARDGSIWCCYRVTNRSEHAAADCINVETSVVEYFYIDGRYDEGGKRELCLVEEVPAWYFFILAPALWVLLYVIDELREEREREEAASQEQVKSSDID